MVEPLTPEQFSPVVLYSCVWQNRSKETFSPKKYTYTYRLLYFEKGECEITVRNQTHLLKSHTGFFLPPGETYTTRSLSGDATYMYNIWFDLQSRESASVYIRNLSDPQARLSYQHPLPQTAVTGDNGFFGTPREIFPNTTTKLLLGKLIQERSSRQQFCDRLSDLYLHQILLYLIREPQNISTEPTDVAARTVKQYIDEHITEALTCEQVSLACAYHPNYINRVIKRATGMSFHRYLTDVKLRYAAELLVNTTDSITEIAYLLSFSSSSHFSNLFASVYQMSPSDYRKFFS